MSEVVYEPDYSFDFTKISLISPTLINGGNYFIKFLMENNNPLYVQPPKCNTKQGIIKTNGGKKHYCDLVFSNINESFIKWIEDLEKYTQDYIFKNREKWFESQLDIEDIENSFTPSLKIYKSGKSYILRTIIPTRLGKCNLKIFNEDLTEFNNEDFKETTDIITILEFQGIRCSSKSFQIDIEIKQMMILRPNILFEKCIINNKPSNTIMSSHIINGDGKLRVNYDNDNNNSLDEKITYNNDNNLDDKITDNVNNLYDKITDNVNNLDEKITHNNVNNLDDKITDNNDNNLDDNNFDLSEKIIHNQINVTDQDDGRLTEIDLDLVNISQDVSIQLKNRNDIYYNLYKQALKKAIDSRNLAINSYLEIKKFKNMFILDNLTNEDIKEEEYLESLLNLKYN